MIVDRFIATRNAREVGANPNTVVALAEDPRFYRLNLHKIRLMRQVDMSLDTPAGKQVLALEQQELDLPVVTENRAQSDDRHAAFRTVLELSRAEAELQRNKR